MPSTNIAKTVSMKKIATRAKIDLFKHPFLLLSDPGPRVPLVLSNVLLFCDKCYNHILNLSFMDTYARKLCIEQAKI